MNTAAGDNPTDDRLDALRRRGDAEADAVAARLAAARPDLDPHQLIRAALDELRRERMRTRVAAAAPTAAGTETTVAAASASMSESTKVVRDWFVNGPPLPEWVDRRRLAHGQQVFGRWSLPIAASLFCASLPFTYAADKGVQVLVLTSDLATNNLHRRIGENGRAFEQFLHLHTAVFSHSDLEFDDALHTCAAALPGAHDFTAFTPTGGVLFE